MIDIWYLCVVLPLFICTLPLVTSDERGWPLPGLFITRQTLASGQTLQNLGPGSSHRSLVPCDQWADLIPIRRRECHDMMMTHTYLLHFYYCEAQGKGRARGGPRKVTGRSFMDGGWWISFPWCFTLKLVATTTHHQVSMSGWMSQLRFRWGRWR